MTQKILIIYNIMMAKQSFSKGTVIKKKIKVKSLAGTPYLICEEEEIGRGSFGRVVKAYKRDEPSLQLVAKIIPISQQNICTIKSEIEILKQIPHHQNLVNYKKLQIASERNFYFIMEYCNGGTLKQYIKDNHNCSEEIVWRFLKSFVNGYKVLYDAHVVHRDIKPDNILLHNGVIKIADFGFSLKMNHHNLNQNMSAKGTPLYIAPEIQEGGEANSKVDVFSLGVVLYRLAFNAIHPFYDEKNTFSTFEDYYQHVKKTKIKFPNYPKRSKQLTDLIQGMLKKNPAQRISWKQIFQHHRLVNLEQNDAEFDQQTNLILQVRKSVLEIGKSIASLKIVEQPFNFTGQVNAELERLIEFTQYLPAFEVQGLEIFVTKSKIFVELIKHLNANLKGFINDKKNRDFVKAFKQIITEGVLFCYYQLEKVQKIIKNYETQETNKEIKEKLLQNLQSDRSFFHQELSKIKENKTYVDFKYQGLLYDRLTQFTQLSHQIQQKLKIPVALMIDLYDGLLKFSQIIVFNESGRIQLKSIDLEDAELDKIDYNNPSSYQKYLYQINDVTLQKVNHSLKSMGLMII